MSLPALMRQGSTWRFLRPQLARSGARCIVRAASSDASQDVKSKLKDAELLKTDCFVGGEWSGAESGETMPVYNPATNEVVANVPVGGAKETSRAISAAADAFPAWKAKTAKERGSILRKWYDLVVEASDDIASIMTFECGKPFAEAKAECVGGAGSIEWFAEEGRRIQGDVLQTVNPNTRFLTQKSPVGVVGAITPWNFPMSMITRKVSPALAAGCTVVLKPAEVTPLTALSLAELGRRAGIPAGVLNIVVGDAPAIGDTLIASDTVRKIGFTGSTGVGKKLAAGAADTVKRVSLELGGNAPFIIFDDADVETAAQMTVSSAFRNAGQTCICASRIFVQEGIHKQFVEAITAVVNGLKLGSGFDEGVTMGPLISPTQRDRVHDLVKEAVSKGAKPTTGGGIPNLGGQLDKGYFMQPTVLDNATLDMKVYKEEIFGPAMPIITFKQDKDAIKMANDTEYGLAAYFWTKDLARAFKAAEQLDYGMVGINEQAITSEIAPFGGIKHSGVGRENSKYGLEEFLQLKTLVMGVGYNKSL